MDRANRLAYTPSMKSRNEHCLPVRCISLATIFVLSCWVRGNAETVQFHVSGSDGKPVACRVYLTNDQGESLKVAGQPFWHDHFVCTGRFSAELEPGRYGWQIERGPEWSRSSGKFDVTPNQPANVGVTLARITTLRKDGLRVSGLRENGLREDGWYGGDMHVHRLVDEIEPLNRPLDLSVRSREFPSPMRFVQEARQLNMQVWIDIEKPLWWDVPTWLATGQMNSSGIANNHICRSEMLASEAWGKPRDSRCLPDPVGDNRVYVHLGDQTDQHLTTTLKADQPGWFLLRAIADVENTFLYTSMAPWYVDLESGEIRFIQTSSQFFLDWVNERIERVNIHVSDADERQSVMQWHVNAREFWTKRVRTGTADLAKIAVATDAQPSRQLARGALRMQRIVQQLGALPEIAKALQSIEESRTNVDLDEAVAPLTLFSISISPEARVKIVATRDRLALPVGITRRFIVKCENTAGLTSLLRIQAMDVSADPPTPAGWCDVRVLDSPVVSSQFSGETEEYKIVELALSEPGLHEVRFIADAGQGTQDLGFRASTDLLIDVEK
jgi:hypothetical protein